jgi:hypothetical protein
MCGWLVQLDLIKIDSTDMAGRVVLSRKNNNDTIFQIDLDKQNAGIYLVKFTTQEGVITKKVGLIK